MFALFSPRYPSPRNKLNRWQGKATVEVEIAPHSTGRIHFRGTDWTARCLEALTLVPGEQVEVMGIEDNLTILVRPIEAR